MYHETAHCDCFEDGVYRLIHKRQNHDVLEQVCLFEDPAIRLLCSRLHNVVKNIHKLRPWLHID